LALILNIDTATEFASVCLSNNEEVLAIEYSHNQKNHASFLQPAIQQLLKSNNLTLAAIDAIALTNGPGSYTGLRVGLASAKGLCYALNKPLIALNTLEVMAQAAMQETSNQQTTNNNFLYCPMIDARRMEVFTAIYTAQLKLVLEPTARIIDEASFAEQLATQPIIFSGNGHQKLKSLLNNTHAHYSNVQHNASHIVPLALQAFMAKQFDNLAYSQPFYLKEFFSPQAKNIL
jgi:tRNA threonylcarbamoyladenosine biosynthesis protein TsaB